MNVLEIIPSWPIRIELIEHVRALETSSINLVLGIAYFEQEYTDSRVLDLLSQFSTPYYDLPKFSWSANFRNLNQSQFSTEEKNLAYIIDKHNINLVHFHSWYDAAQLQRVVLDLAIPFTISVESSDIHLLPVLPPQNEDLEQKFHEVLNSTAKIQVPYDIVSSDLSQLYPSSSPTTTIQIPIPSTDIAPNVVNTGKHLISIGQLWWENGFHDLVRAMVHMPDVSLDIIGEGTDERHLVFLIHTYNLQDRVRVLDDISFDRYRELIGKATAYVHSGISQDVSYPLLLAMSLGKPVFVTNNRGVNEVVENNYNGIYIPIGEPTGMVEQFKRLDDSDLMERIGKSARTSIETLLASDDTHADKFVQFYQDVWNDTTGRG